ncbi:MAG: hypothetical protein AAFX55_13870 [Bacteroidota bacterium]
MIKTYVIISTFFIGLSLQSQTIENQSDEINFLINYIPSNLANEDYKSDFEKKHKTKVSSLNTLFSICLAKNKLKLTDATFLVLENHVRELATEFFNDGKLLLLNGYMSDGCSSIKSEMIKGVKIKTLIWCHGDLYKNHSNISRFFDIFNEQMKNLISKN